MLHGLFHNVPASDLEEIEQNLHTLYPFIKGKTICILGGEGFLGSLIKKFLLFANISTPLKDDPCQIISIDNYIGRDPSILIQDKNLVNLSRNIIDENSLDDILIADYIINASGCAAPSIYEKYPLETMDVSYIGTKNVLELARRCRSTVLMFSSSEVLGTPDDKNIPTGEHVLPNVASDNKRAPYDISKLALETLSWIYKNKYNVDVKVVRLFNCIGYFRKDDYRVIPNFISAILSGQKMKVYLPSNQTRTFSFYTDVIVGIFLVLFKGQDFLYHIGSPDNEITILELAQKIEKMLDKQDLIEIVKTPSVYLTEPKRRCPCINKIKNELGFQPKVNLDDMLKRIYEWAQRNY